MNRGSQRRVRASRARSCRAMTIRQVTRPRTPLATFEFIKLRHGRCCVPAVEIVAGEESVVGEIPDGIDRTALSEWLVAHGLLQITR